MFPTAEQLKQIYQNASVANEFGLAGKYWSSSIKDSASAYCLDYESGEVDYTTLDHKFNVLLIRKLAL